MSELAPRTKIFVGRLPDTCQQTDLETLFSAYGTVRECDILANYGFVHMSTPEEAEAAIRGLHNHELHGTRITVEASTSRPRTFPRGGGMGGTGRGFPSRGRYIARGYSTWGRTRPYPDVYGDRAASAYASQPPYDPANRYNYYTTNSRPDSYPSPYAYDVDYSAYASNPYGAAAAYGAGSSSMPATPEAAAAAAYNSNAYSTNAYSTAAYSASASNSSYPTYSTDSASLAWSRYASKDPEFCEF